MANWIYSSDIDNGTEYSVNVFFSLEDEAILEKDYWLFNNSKLDDPDIDIDKVLKKDKNFSEFILRIFKNFYEKSNAYFDLRLDEERERLSKLLGHNGRQVIDLLLKDYVDRLENIVKDYKKDNKLHISISNKSQVLNVLEDNYGSYVSDKYENTAGNFISAVLHDYCMQRPLKRAEIYFSDLIDIFNDAVKEHHVLLVSTCEKRHFLFCPYKLAKSEQTDSLYFVGYSKVIGEEAFGQSNDFILVSFNVSSISDGGLKESQEDDEYYNEYLTPSTTKDIEKKLKDRGPSFLFTAENEEIKIISLTKKGMQLFRKKTHLRPNALEKPKKKGDKYLLKFDWPRFAITNYFFSFGEDVEILEPIAYRRKFKEKLEKALDNYKD